MTSAAAAWCTLENSMAWSKNRNATPPQSIAPPGAVPIWNLRGAVGFRQEPGPDHQVNGEGALVPWTGWAAASRSGCHTTRMPACR